jgi:hypothetical protein
MSRLLDVHLFSGSSKLVQHWISNGIALADLCSTDI